MDAAQMSFPRCQRPGRHLRPDPEDPVAALQSDATPGDTVTASIVRAYGVQTEQRCRSGFVGGGTEADRTYERLNIATASRNDATMKAVAQWRGPP